MVLTLVGFLLVAAVLLIRWLLLLLHLLVELLSLSFLLALGEVLLLGGRRHPAIDLGDVEWDMLVLDGLARAVSSLCSGLLDKLEDLSSWQALRGARMHNLRERLAIVLEPELLPDQFVLIGDHKIELLHHAAATCLNEVLLLLDIQIVIEVILHVVVGGLLLGVHGRSRVIFVYKLLLILPTVLGGCNVAATLRWVVVYTYKLGQVVHDIVFIQVVLQFDQVLVNLVKDVPVVVARPARAAAARLLHLLVVVLETIVLV